MSDTPESFTWRDADRTVAFRPQALERAPELLRELGFPPFELLSTARAVALAPALAGAATALHTVAPGGVPEAAAALLVRVSPAPLVALGGGRVIDVAKAVAAVQGGPVAAVPTTMSGAEMTGIHRLPAGAEGRAQRLVRPLLVIADPGAMTSLPEAALRASCMNALAHGIDSLHTPLANPVSGMLAARGIALISTELDREPAARARPALALGSLLCGYAIDSAHFGLHHAVCQTLVRVCGAPHAETNAAILPGAAAMLLARAPDRLAPAAAAAGVAPDGLEARLRQLAGFPAGLGALGADRRRLGEALDQILARPELGFTPDPPGRDEIEQLILAAW